MLAMNDGHRSYAIAAILVELRRSYYPRKKKTFSEINEVDNLSYIPVQAS